MHCHCGTKNDFNILTQQCLKIVEFEFKWGLVMCRNRQITILIYFWHNKMSRMLSRRYKSAKVNSRTWLHVPSGNSDTHQIVEIHKETSAKIYTSFFNLSERKRTKSDSVLWQKPIHQQKCHKGKVTTQTTPQKCPITQRLLTDLERSVGVTTATKLVWLIWFTGPTFLLPATTV